MAKRVMYLSESDAVKTTVATLLDHVRSGGEVVIEKGSRPVAVLKSAEVQPGRLLSESIALAEARANELGSEPTLDPDFASDLAAIIDSRKPRDTSRWE